MLGFPFPAGRKELWRQGKMKTTKEETVVQSELS